jgi:hypothetical protein
MILRFVRLAGAGLLLTGLLVTGLSVSSCISMSARLTSLEATAPPAAYRIERDA